MKQLIRTGISFIGKNQTIISSLLLIFVVVGALFLNSYITISRFQDNIDKTLRAKALLAENIIVLTADHFFSMPNGSEELQSKLSEIQKNDSEISQISLYLLDKESGQFVPLVAPTNDEQKNSDPQKEMITEHARKFSASVDDAFAYLSSDAGVRYWNVVKSIKGEDHSVQGILQIKLSLAQSDELTQKAITQVYMLSIGGIIIVLLLVFNHLRLFSYEVKAKKLEEIDKMKDDFIAMASHELRSPLTAIAGYSELLADTLETEPSQEMRISQKKYLGNIDVSIQRLKTLVADLLDVSRLQQNRLPFDCKPSDLTGMVSSVIDEMQVTADQKKLELVNNIGTLPLAFVDAERTKQILVNLVSNAIKYTPTGKIEMQSREDEKWIYITVADTGLGISAENLAQLFSKFYRVRNVKTAQITGTGLGLWIARQIAEKMEGALTVESIEGVGSHFTLKVKKA